MTVVSTIANQPPMIADELRRQADEFIDLAQLKLKLGRGPSERLGHRQEERRGSKIGMPVSERPAD